MYCGGQQCIVLSRIQFIPAIVSNSYQNLLMKVVSNTLQPCVWHLACNIRTAHQIVFAQLSWFLVQPKTRWCPPYFPASNDLAGKGARAPRQPDCALVPGLRRQSRAAQHVCSSRSAAWRSQEPISLSFLFRMLQVRHSFGQVFFSFFFYLLNKKPIFRLESCSCSHAFLTQLGKLLLLS